MCEIIRPPIKSQGIKVKLIPNIKNLAHNVMDDDTVWIEPFLGTGVVALNMGVKVSICGDVNKHIIRLYNMIQSGEVNQLNVIYKLFNHKHSLSEMGDSYYKEVRSRFNDTGDIFDFIFLSRTCFNGLMRFNSKGGFNTPYCKNDEKLTTSLIKKVGDSVQDAYEIINKNWIFEESSFEEFIQKHCLSIENSITYCDPPYLGRNNTYYESWDEEKEETLRNLLVGIPGKFIYSTWIKDQVKDNPAISKYWGDFNIQPVEHYYRVGSFANRRGSIVEALISNF